LPLGAFPTIDFHSRMSSPAHRILYCHCQYAQVVPLEVKREVLRKLCDSGVEFEAVPDLCEMSARHDPSLGRLAAGQGIKVAACFPRAVKWLFAAGGAPLPVGSCEVLNMRSLPAAEVVAGLFAPVLQPNLPTGKVTLPAPEQLPPAPADTQAAVA
jgi:hypothetical protein